MKRKYLEYQPAILLVLILLVLSSVSIFRAEQLFGAADSSHSASPSAYVAYGIDHAEALIRTAAESFELDSARQAINTLIAGVIAVAVAGVGTVVYLNIKLVRARRKLTAQDVDLRTTNRLKERFIESATHELNTPLTVTTALTDVLARNTEGNLTERQLKQIAAVQRNNRHLQDLVGVMIQTTTAGDTGILKTEPIQYSEFIQTTLQAIKADLDLQSVHIEWSVRPSSDQVTISSERISQVVANLVLNASQHSPEGAIVFVSTDRVGENIETCIRDFGPGIPAVDQPHVFSPFYRVYTEANRRVRSAGLGLTLVKLVVESHGGEVKLVSNENEKGSTFCFSLPVAS